MKKYLKDDFIRHNVVFFFGSLGVSAINYLYAPIISRLLGVEQFGEVQALFAVLAQVTAIYGALELASVNIVSNTEDDQEAKNKLFQIQKWSWLIFAVIILVGFAFLPQLTRTFSLSGASTFLVLIGLIAGGVFVLPRRAFLSGRHRFGKVASINMVVSIARLVFGVGLIALGWSVFGAFVGQLIAVALSGAFAVYTVRRIEHTPKRSTLPASKLNMKKHFAYAILILFTSGFTSLLVTADIIIIKYLFSPEVAGVYSGISTIARTIYFLTGSMIGVMFPSIKRHATYQENAKLLVKAMGMTALVGGGALLGFFLLPELAIKILLGNKFLPLAHMLPYIGVIMLFGSLANVLFFYFLALRNFKVIFVSIFSFAILSTSVYLFHDSPAQIVNGFIATSIASTLALAVMYSYYYLQRPKS